MMKNIKPMLFKQQGSSILEVLIGMIIFSVVAMGTAMMMNRTMAAQKEINKTTKVVNELSRRLQSQIDCGFVNVDNYTLKGSSETEAANSNNGYEEYFIGCALNETANEEDAKWPVLAASQISKAVAEECARGDTPPIDGDTHNCYIIGR